MFIYGYEVAVKEFAVPRPIAAAKVPQFMCEVFLQEDAQHPCIVQTLRGIWPDPEEDGDEDEIQACIVMERLTCNLLGLRDRGLLESLESKLRILSDVASGIAHLHSRRVVHRDSKPENIPMSVVDGQIIGRAKVYDFGVLETRSKPKLLPLIHLRGLMEQRCICHRNHFRTRLRKVAGAPKTFGASMFLCVMFS